LISVDELRAAGALDVPPSWRKSLGGQRDPLTLFDKHADAAKDEASEDDADDDERADEQS
jgi:hypothetical protein